MPKATASAQAGDLILFEDGTYLTTQMVTFARSGTAANPIILQAKNKHKAILRFQNVPGNKLRIDGVSYITIADFEITQDVRGTTWADILVQCWINTVGCTVRGNKLHNAMEPIKALNSRDTVFSGNTIFNGKVGLGSINTEGMIIEGNDISGMELDAIQTKGGTRTAIIRNNYIHASSAMEMGVVLGGSTTYDAEWTYDPKGYEGYNIVAVNNVIVAEVKGVLDHGIYLMGCSTCLVANNVVVNVKYAIQTQKGPGVSKGWAWDPPVHNATIVNNIILDATSTGAVFNNISGTLVHDYNLYHNTPNVPGQVHAVKGDPQFYNKLSDWRVHATSPAKSAGTSLSFKGFRGEAIDLSYDKEGIRRLAAPTLGAYEINLSPEYNTLPQTGSDKQSQAEDFGLENKMIIIERK